jgi:Outer membrane protein beta-barrel domain
MPALDVWDQLTLFSQKVIAINQPIYREIILFRLVFIALIMMAPGESFSQRRWAKRSNPEYDKRTITYGFSLGFHTTAYQLKYADDFVTNPNYDTLHSIQASFSPGFSLGFLVNLRFNDQLDLRLMPKASFYEHRLNYYYTTGGEKFPLVETTMVELPLLLKYKSQRRGNSRMYVVGGLSPGFEARNKGDIGSTRSSIEVKKGNLSIDTGFGWDLYFQFFKFSPEIRFSKGLINVLDNGNPEYTDPIKKLNTNTISLFFIFQ